VAVRPPILLFGICALLAGSTSAKDSSCHIHPPGSTPQNPVNTVGPFASPRECETERVRRFGADGRCHCRADFTPRWMPTEPELPGSGNPSELL
jgi:hypothetical protein